MQTDGDSVLGTKYYVHLNDEIEHARFSASPFGGFISLQRLCDMSGVI